MKIKFTKLITMQGQFQSNFEKMKAEINLAKHENYDMVVFSNNSIVGVFSGDYVLNPSLKNKILSYNEKVRALSKDIYVVWGNLFEDYQAILVAKDNLIYSTTKTNRNDRFFQESKYFEEGSPTLIKVEDVCIGFNQPTTTSAFHILFDNLEVGKESESRIQNGILINHFGCENINKNIVVFDGEITLFNDYHVVKTESSLEEKSFDLQSMTHSSHTVLDVIVFALRIFDKQVFNQRFNWIIGLSGGLDSTISAALLTLAFGKERVVGYNLATKYNSAKTKSIAEELALKLGIKYRNGNIEKLVNATQEVLNDYGYDQLSDLTLQNIQARLRGHLLSSFASIENGVIINNGNKVETALGYATMYGDLIGAFAPLADLTKVQLFELARLINQTMNQVIISQDLLPQSDLSWVQKPSAELQAGQFDPMKWFYHDYIVEHLNKDFSINDLLRMYLTKDLPEELNQWIKYYGLDDPKLFIEDVEWLVNTMNRNAYKLVQAPPILSLSLNTFGSDKSIIQGVFQNSEYIQLKDEILKGEAI